LVNSPYLYCNFSFYGILPDGATKLKGRNIVTEYYELEFKVDKDGNKEVVE
jgi:hypothetical protein